MNTLLIGRSFRRKTTDTTKHTREQIIWLAGKRHVFRGGARLGERGWGADAHAQNTVGRICFCVFWDDNNEDNIG